MLRIILISTVLLINTVLASGNEPLNQTAAASGNGAQLTGFSNFWGNTKDSFTGYNALLGLTGAGLTYALVNGNVDYKLNKYFHEHLSIGNWFTPVFLTGTFGPIALSAGLYFGGKSGHDERMRGAGLAVLQASVISVAANSVLKFFTGRPNPDYTNYSDTKELSKTFNFGFGKRGIFWGWPSGHTGITMAAASALAAYYPEKTWVKVAGYAMVAYTMVGVTSVHNGQMHWFSDAVAAAFIHWGIGNTVGKYYRNRMEGKNGRPASFQILPSFSSDATGLQISYKF